MGTVGHGVVGLQERPKTGTAVPLDVCIISPGLAHSGDVLRQKSLGGSETAAVLVAKALAARNHFVTVFSPGGNGVHDGVTYLPLEMALPYCSQTPHDVTVISRALEFLPVPFASKLRVLWCHDLALKRMLPALSPGLWNLDAIYVLSEFHRRQFTEVYAGVPPEFFHVTRNGVDLPSLTPLRTLPRDPTKLVYGSRPERGLEACLAVMRELARRGSPLVLHCAWYENIPPHLAGYYEALWQQARALPNVKLLGPLAQPAWHRELATARALIYPGPVGQWRTFREIACIAAIEAQAVGTPIVACAKGALVETARGQRLVGDEATDCGTADYLSAFADAVQDVTGSDTTWQALHAAGLARDDLGWDGVAAEWEADWLARFDAMASDPWATARYLARIGEHEAADA